MRTSVYDINAESWMTEITATIPSLSVSLYTRLVGGKPYRAYGSYSYTGKTINAWFSINLSHESGTHPFLRIVHHFFRLPPYMYIYVDMYSYYSTTFESFEACSAIDSMYSDVDLKWRKCRMASRNPIRAATNYTTLSIDRPFLPITIREYQFDCPYVYTGLSAIE